VFNNINISFTR